MGGGQDKPAWTACPPGVKITRVGGKITRDSLPPGGQAVQGGKINCYTGTVCAIKTVEGDFQFCWMISPNIGQTHKENPNLVRIFYMTFTLNDIYKQYNKLHEH